ncbi:hypothetical protein Tco_1057642 [Tanacetum coccineum]|uniref:Transposase (putative) gypsy type domain-containing protein n=1 Tax=Tanacetum coccineum TaxID=301880 RepID=A0ABQ5H623_9ASTR
MSAITDIRCVLTQKALDAFCDKFHIPEEVHPVLPNQNDTMHERPAGKIGLYTRFFDYANFRLPLSTFLVDVLRHFRINISQLSVIGAAKFSHFEILCRVYGIIPTVGLFRCFYVNSKKNGWMSFSKRSDNAPKFPEAFLYLVGLSRHYTLDEKTYPWFLHKNREEMDIFAFIHATDPTKVKIVEREQNEGEPLLLETTIGRTVPLLLVAPDRAESELEASVDRLFDEGGSGNQTEQGDSASGGEGADVQPVSEPADTVVKDVAPLQPRRQRKRKTVVVDAGESSHPPKRLREDHGTPIRVAAIPTLPFVRAFVSTTPEHEVRDHTDFVAGPNLHTIGAPQRFVISSDSSHHSGANVAEAEVDSLVRSSAPIMTTVTTVTSMVDPALVAKEKPVKPSLFSANSSSAGGADPIIGVFSDLTGSDFLVGGIRTVINPDTNLQKVYVPQWSLTNGSRLDDGRVCHEMVDEFAPPKFFASVHGMEHDQLFTEFNVGAARQMSLSVEVRMRAEYNVKDKRRLKSVVEKQDELLKAMDGEIEDLKAQLLFKEIKAAEATHLCAQTSNLEAVEKSLRDEVNALKERNAILENEKNALDVKVTDLEASVVGKERDLTNLNAQLTSAKSQNDNLVDWVHELEISSAGLQEKIAVYDNCMEQLEKFQYDRMKVVNDKLAKLDADLAEMACHLEERFYPYLLNTISGRRWLLTRGLKLFLVKCLNSSEYLTALGAAISRAIEKGMQSGLAAGIDHGREGRSLADVAAYNPDAEAGFNFALQKFRALVDAPRMNDLQPDIEQLKVPIHRFEDQVVLGETSLSFVLSVSHSCVERIWENIAAQRSALVGVWTPLPEPLSVTSLMGEASSIPSISTDDYEIVGVDGQEGASTDGQAIADGNVAPFPNVDDVELNIPQ